MLNKYFYKKQIFALILVFLLALSGCSFKTQQMPKNIADASLPLKYSSEQKELPRVEFFLAAEEFKTTVGEILSKAQYLGAKIVKVEIQGVAPETQQHEPRKAEISIKLNDYNVDEFIKFVEQNPKITIQFEKIEKSKQELYLKKDTQIEIYVQETNAYTAKEIYMSKQPFIKQIGFAFEKVGKKTVDGFKAFVLLIISVLPLLIIVCALLTFFRIWKKNKKQEIRENIKAYAASKALKLIGKRIIRKSKEKNQQSKKSVKQQQDQTITKE